MMNNLPKPFFVLAPMDDVTDTVFRQIVFRCAKPDLAYTEFVNVDGLQSPGRERLLHKLRLSSREGPVIAQLWGLKPENYYKTVKELVDGSLVAEANGLRSRKTHPSEVQGSQEKRTKRINDTLSESRTQLTQQFAGSTGKATGFASGRPGVLRFSGVDVNMGCPVKTVIKNGACAALINNRELAGEIIDAVHEAASSVQGQAMQLDDAQGENAERSEAYSKYNEVSTANSQHSASPEVPSRVGGLANKQAGAVHDLTHFPVSIKTRVGFNNVDMSWIEFLLSKKILNMLSIHGRTAKQLSAVPADWNLIGQAVSMRDSLSPGTLIVGNGDVSSMAEARELAEKHRLDGIMIGRGIFHDPFIFSDSSPWESYSREQKLELFKKHIELYIEAYDNNERRFETLRKFCKVYINGFEGASELRSKFMNANDPGQSLTLLYADKVK